MGGGALDTQLYAEKWEPTPEQQRKVALDVAHGMKCPLWK
jgi:hypothetical protein